MQMTVINIVLVASTKFKATFLMITTDNSNDILITI